MGTPKLTIGHFIALQREEIKLQPPEHRHKLPQPGNLDKPVVQPHLEEADYAIKRNHKLPDCRKDTQNTIIKQMKKQRNIQQVKKCDECPSNQTKEEGIGSSE